MLGISATHGETWTPLCALGTLRQVFYSDVCCGDRKIIQETLGPASCALSGSTTASPSAAAEEMLPHLDFPPDGQPIKIVVEKEQCDLSAFACSQLLSRARESARTVAGGATVLGFDCEWSVWVSGARPVATIQLSTLDGCTVVFHIKPRENRDGIVPKALEELLVNESVLLVSGPTFVRRNMGNKVGIGR